MSDNKIIYEIAQMMQNSNSIQSDMLEIKDNISKLLQEKYINRIHKAIQIQEQELKQNPTREIQLLRALKAFSDDSKQDHIDKMIDSLFMVNTLQNINSEMARASNNIKAAEYQNHSDNSSIHEDGIYDIDTTCLNKNRHNNNGINMASMLLIMSIFGGAKGHL